jgi:DNA polymerase-3 subunit delta
MASTGPAGPFGGGPADASKDLLGDGEGPLYWICGKERFLVDRAVHHLKQRVLDAATRDFNYDLLYAKEAGAQRIVAAARTLPMMARRRLLVVRDADLLDAKGLEPLIPYLLDPAPESCLVFVAEAADLTKKKFFAAFQKRGSIVRFDPLKERQLPGFVRDEGRARKLRLDPGVAELLADEVGADLGQLVDAMERIELFVVGRGGERRVTVEDVETVVTTTRQRSVFELLDAIGEGETGRALAALGSLQAAREPALKTLALVTRLVRQMMIAREVIDRRGGKADVAQALGLPPFLVDKIESQARRHPGAALRAMHAAVYRADYEIKRVEYAARRLDNAPKLDDDRRMEGVVLELTRASTATRRARSQG